MLKIVSIIGARPQFIKLAAFARVVNRYFSTKLDHKIIHTGQHYDKNMSEVFFNELQIDVPAYHLSLHTNQGTFPMRKAVCSIEQILQQEKPDLVIVYGDTYSTLAGALAADHCNIALAHIEAGMRSYDQTMPEEVVRVETDKLATYLYCATQTAMNNLQKEGVSLNRSKPYHKSNKKIMFSGDLMYDNALYYAEKISIDTLALRSFLQHTKELFILTTFHRQHNTDSKEHLQGFVEGLLKIAEKKVNILFPVHPRTRKMFTILLPQEIYQTFSNHPYIHCVEPLSFLEMLYVEKRASLIITDSGGVQKEAYFFQKPCIILRSETEWIELLHNKCGLLCDTKADAIAQTYHYFVQHPPLNFPPVFGKGQAARYICESILEILNENISER